MLLERTNIADAESFSKLHHARSSSCDLHCLLASCGRVCQHFAATIVAERRRQVIPQTSIRGMLPRHLPAGGALSTDARHYGAEVAAVPSVLWQRGVSTGETSCFKINVSVEPFGGLSGSLLVVQHAKQRFNEQCGGRSGPGELAGLGSGVQTRAQLDRGEESGGCSPS